PAAGTAPRALWNRARAPGVAVHHGLDLPGRGTKDFDEPQSLHDRPTDPRNRVSAASKSNGDATLRSVRLGGHNRLDKGQLREIRGGCPRRYVGRPIVST